VRVADLGDIEDGEVLGVKVDGKAVCLARIEETVYAFADNCSHRDFPLSLGELETDDCSITCEWHGARFDQPMARENSVLTPKRWLASGGAASLRPHRCRTIIAGNE
jgi:hypothetical protein